MMQLCSMYMILCFTDIYDLSPEIITVKILTKYPTENYDEANLKIKKIISKAK